VISGGTLSDRAVEFFSAVCEPIRVDMDSDATGATTHMPLRLEKSGGVLEVLPATRTLKPDFNPVANIEQNNGFAISPRDFMRKPE
jgi:hypothetical protein